MGAWEEIRGELAASSDRDFERKVLPLLRLFWPSLQQAIPLQVIDRAGIDLHTPGENEHFACAIQCKGFYKHEQFLIEQLPQAQKSIKSFLNSSYSCDSYVFVHNRTGENREVHNRLVELCNKLVEENKAKSIEILDRQTLIKKCKVKLREILGQRLTIVAEQSLASNRNFFLFGSVVVENIPVRTYDWKFGYEASPPRPILSDTVNVEAINKILSRKRWTMLLGSFGSGKTTTALSLAARYGGRILYVRSEGLLNRGHGVGTNALLQNMLESIEIFDEFSDDSLKLMNRLASVALRSILCSSEAYMLIIDALDESEKYSTSKGLIQLTNELEELRCEIVLVTRQEHFDSIYSDMESVLDNITKKTMSVKGGKKRQCSIVSLENWTKEQQVEFFDACQSTKEGLGSGSVRLLCQMVRNGNLDEKLSELQYHPLFMHMLAEYVHEVGEVPAKISDLISKWLEFKLKRDFKSGRSLAWEEQSESRYVRNMLYFTDTIASTMIREMDDDLWLIDKITGEEIERLFYETIPRKEIDLSSFASGSLMVPASRDMTKFRFFHRVVHEFCAARYYVNQGIVPAQVPDSVLGWYNELENE